ncbi:uncharacterized protein TNCV_1927911 [Trichonephila clavipes]|nr:uncharacterized protein TNCV_1927911 [Trichonephila clavipes]
MLKYCRSDVDILRRCCKIFREQFQSVTGMDPFTYVTIASACMAVYRSGHIKPKTIAMIPVQGYCNSTNFSRDSIRWLNFVAHTEGHRILHALKGTGEPKIAGYSVDGFCKETNTVYQYQGCFHHSCEICYDGDLIHPLAATTMRRLRQKKEGVIDTLRQRGYNIIQMLEHDFVHLKKTEKFQEFLLQHEVIDRLNPRDAFFGRTNGIQLLYEGYKNSINVNLGRRSVAKLALNSFWGRWGMNLNKNKLTFVSTVHDFNKMLMDKTKDIKDVFLPTPEIAAFQWTQRGPKNYAYKLSDGSEVCKIRGFTLNFQNSLVLNYESVKELVSSMDASRFMTITNPRKITRDKKKRKVENKIESKTYIIVYNKRVIQDDFSTLPYGY